MNSGVQDNRSWDAPPKAMASGQPRKTTHEVPDDWDLDVDEDNTDPNKLWEEANSKAPMPEILVTATSSASVPPPQTAFAPSLRILKRPQSQSPKPPGSATPQKTILERQADYQAARERIFAAAKPEATLPAGSNAPDKVPQKRSATPMSDVIRQPLGPSPTSGRGFGNRRGRGTASPGNKGASPRGSPRPNENVDGSSDAPDSPTSAPSLGSAD